MISASSYYYVAVIFGKNIALVFLENCSYEKRVYENDFRGWDRGEGVAQWASVSQKSLWIFS